MRYSVLCMRRLTGMVALLLLCSLAMPLLACVDGGAMTQQESACCQTMHGNCGAMEKMGCCREVVRTNLQPQLAASAPTLDMHWAVVAWLKPSVGAQTVRGAALRAADLYSPPGLLSAQITVLRI